MIGHALILVLASTPIGLEEVRQAARQQLDSIRAELEVERSKTGVSTARSSIWPQVSLSAGGTEIFNGPQRIFSTVPVTTNGVTTFEQRSVDVPAVARSNFNLGIQINQLLYDGGRWWNQIALAGAQVEASQGRLDEQRLSSELEAIRRFYELLRAQLTIDVLTATLDRSREQLTRAKSLYEAGRVQSREVLDAEVNVDTDQIQLLRQGQQVVVAQTDLLRWIGREYADVRAVDPGDLGKPVPVPVFEKAVSTAKSSRPLFKSYEAQQRADELSVSVARADYLPRVGILVGLQRNGPTADPFFTDPIKQNSLSAGLNLSWDLFSGFATDAAVERARIDARSTIAQAQQAARDLEAEIQRALVAYDVQMKIAEIAERSRKTAALQLTQENDRFAAGAGSMIEVRNAQIKLSQAELNQLQGKIDIQIARAALNRVIGKSFDAEVSP